MVITYQGNSIYPSQKGAVLTIQLNDRKYRVRWGRDWHEKGNLPRTWYIADHLLNAGFLDGIKTKRVPILADKVEYTDDKSTRYTEVIKPGWFIHGILIKFMEEKRVYVIAHFEQGQSEHYILPKIGKF